MVNFLRNCQTVFPRHLHHFTFSPERHKAYNSSISLLYDQAAQDGYSLALCTPPAWPVSSLFTGYSPDWPSYILAPAAAAAAAKLLQSCPTLCDPVDGSPLGSSVPGILQARILELVAISFSNACKWKVKVKSPSNDLFNFSCHDSLLKGQWEACAFAGFPGNQWPNQMSIPLINSTPPPPLSLQQKPVAVSRLSAAGSCSRHISFSIHEIANVSVTDSGFFLWSQDRQVQGLQACGVQPNNWQCRQGDGENSCKCWDIGWVTQSFGGYSLTFGAKSCVGNLSTSVWGPVVSVLDEWGPPREYGGLIDNP